MSRCSPGPQAPFPAAPSCRPTLRPPAVKSKTVQVCRPQIDCAQPAAASPFLSHKVARLRPAGDPAAQSFRGLEARNSERWQEIFEALVLQDLEVWRGGAASTPRSGSSTQQIVRDVTSRARSGAAGRRNYHCLISCMPPAKGVFPDFPSAGLADAPDGQHPGPRPRSAARVLSRGQRGGEGLYTVNVKCNILATRRQRRKPGRGTYPRGQKDRSLKCICSLASDSQPLPFPPSLEVADRE